MSNATELHRALDDFQDILNRHLILLREEDAALQAAWFSLRDVYQGDGADVFEAAFLRARQTLTAYQTAGETISPILRERIDALGRFDHPDSTL